ncbi:BUB3-interacting and GLEBS motif-containing protein ZNF207-like isoform X2 [Tachypleus tridentatus]|uniref:BUB3-interacting and GLEBS motif-containing protein ZNF207-like isoform X2 n=1 Tax=Tachypleus tridentatus TaxID=6853 RepID=UPI003FD3FDC3
MGRKKKKPAKPWCWYCSREFDDEKILIQHQKAKHFKCHICHKKLYTGPGLAIHCMQVHKETIDKVPNALPNRNNVDIEIYGMEGIPEEDIREHERQRQSGLISDEGSDSDVSKSFFNTTVAGGLNAPMPPGVMPPMPGIMPPMPGMPFPQAMPGVPPIGPMPPMTGGHLPALGMGVPFMGPRMPPVTTMPMGSVATSSMQPGLRGSPPVSGMTTMITGQTLAKPLFPAAGKAKVTSSSAPVGTDFKPLNSSSVTSPSTFQSHGSNSLSGSLTEATLTKNTISTKPSVGNLSETKKTEVINTTGATSKIMHPEEDISLEEKRARLPKYHVIPGVTQPAVSGVMMPSTSVGKGVVGGPGGPVPPTTNSMMNGMNMMRPPMGMMPGMAPVNSSMGIPFANPGPMNYPQGPMPPMMPRMMPQSGPPRPY